ncbi:PTS sugar transporter subunit IIA [Enterococcus pallens]|uniref:PTS EIIA type-4 domain-containing protein n=1 Tax=Enterococcus pallens ATCC BAA-351 TaxID=1158607 RepID=R2SFM7_9ENTE|nr:PTS sugar transporter subunit IIA [Enterococcus pallens]EOH91721.1 hypothetical protein UAU_03023 [Enterococcus pallens ATCC BAA-351]EOU25149.1 hypothetical protein I588_01137 [Enterococcus pallens ATCC BAA-351]OJG78453.1 hypothetical protein RV10_GL001448 [Enterococcus pallens]
MKGILLIGHATISQGVLEALELFCGNLEQVEALSLELEQDIQEFSQKLKAAVDAADTGQGVVVFCDLAFGTPSNVAAQLLNTKEYKDRVQIITGMNLPMVLEYTQSRTAELDFSEVVQVGKEGIIDLNERINNK